MSSRSFTAAVLGAGLFLGLAATVAAASGAAAPAVVFGALALGHGLAAIPAHRSRLVRVVRVVVGVVELVGIGVAAWFIAGIVTAESIDLTAAWFAPLNGYATVVVGAVLAVVAAGLVANGVRGGDRRTAEVVRA